MTFWIIILRSVGTIVFLIGVLGGVYNNLTFPITENIWWVIYHVWLPVIEQLVLAVLCFGAAAGLKQLRQTDQRIARAAAGRRRTAQQTEQPRNLAPDALQPASTARYMDEGDRLRYGVGRVLRRVDQDYINRKYAYRIPDPNVRAAPAPIRVTPGTEEQYTADTQQLRAYRRPPPGTFQRALDEPVVDREMLRRARDQQLREMQAGRVKNRKFRE